MTTRQKSSSSRMTYNHPCLIAQTLDLLGDRWTLLVLRDLMAGLHRYSDILESCSGMSPNVLSDRLKRLEAEGLVKRTYERGLPPKVDYSLTDKGWSVRPILVALASWGREHFDTFTEESVGSEIPADFAVRVFSTLAFDPARADGLCASMVIEIDDCDDCNSWTLRVDGGRLLPSRSAVENPDVRLQTSPAGFLRFLRKQCPPAECGALSGDPAVAQAIQECFAG